MKPSVDKRKCLQISNLKDEDNEVISVYSDNYPDFFTLLACVTI